MPSSSVRNRTKFDCSIPLLTQLGCVLLCLACSSTYEVANSDAGADAGPSANDGGGDAPEDKPIDVAPLPTTCTEEALASALSRLESDLLSQSVPGGAGIAIGCLGEPIQATGFGRRNQEQPELINGDTYFQIASVSKSLAAATGWLMHHDGDLDARAPLDGVLEGINTSAPFDASFTLEQLLAHSSGYPSNPNLVSRNAGLSAFYADNAGITLWSPPGRVYNYANYGTGVAGLALSRAGDDTYANLVESRLFERFGIERATLHADVVAADDNYAYGHSQSAGPAPLGPMDHYYHAEWYGPMGGAFMSVRSLAQYGLLVAGEDEEFAATKAEMTSPRIRTTDSARIFQGQGLFIEESGDEPFWWHTGSVAGFLAFLEVHPKTGFVFAILMNSDAGYPGQTIAWLRETYGDYASIAPTRNLDPSTVVGEYVDQNGATVRVASDPPAFHFESGAVAPFSPLEEDTALYTDPVYGLTLTLAFWRDEAGAVEYITSPTMVATAVSE